MRITPRLFDIIVPELSEEEKRQRVLKTQTAVPLYILPMCEALIDQGKYIDGDPVGRCCTNRATHIYYGNFVCDECITMIRSGSTRITFTPKTIESEAGNE